MFSAKVYRVMIGSLSGAMEEVYVTKEALQRWNQENAERSGKVFMPVEWNTKSEDYMIVDVVICVIGNRIEGADIIGKCIELGKQVVLFFNTFYDPMNTISSERDMVNAFKSKMLMQCPCIEYNGITALKDDLSECFFSIE